VNFEFVMDGKPFPITIDYFDKMEHIEETALGNSALYLKMQYAEEGYPAHAAGPPILPGGYVVPDKYTYFYLSAARTRADQPERQYDVYGRFSLHFATGIRRKALTALQEQQSFEYFGGDRPVRYSQHLIDAASSKVCLDLPGNGPFCFRLIDYLATGCCIVAVRHRTRFPVPLVPGVHIAYVKEDLSDLVDVCQYYVENEAARTEMRKKSREYFDRYLERRQLASYYLKCCLEASGHLTETAAEFEG
jgi:hypothetical protein